MVLLWCWGAVVWRCESLVSMELFCRVVWNEAELCCCRVLQPVFFAVRVSYAYVLSHANVRDCVRKRVSE